MKLGIIHIVPPYTEFPPERYGGTERVAYYLIKAQEEIKDVITKYLNVDEVSIKVIGRSKKENLKACLNPYIYALRILHQTLKAFEKEYDLILVHNHLIQRNAFLFFHTLTGQRTLSITTLHYDPPLVKSLKYASFILKPAVVAISKNQFNRLKPIFKDNLIGYIHNGLPVEEFPFCKDKGEYLVSLAMISPVKGIHNAIVIAKHSNHKLIIIGPIRDSPISKLSRNT